MDSPLRGLSIQLAWRKSAHFQRATFASFPWRALNAAASNCQRLTIVRHLLLLMPVSTLFQPFSPWACIASTQTTVSAFPINPLIAIQKKFYAQPGGGAVDPSQQFFSFPHFLTHSSPQCKRERNGCAPSVAGCQLDNARFGHFMFCIIPLLLHRCRPRLGQSQGALCSPLLCPMRKCGHSKCGLLQLSGCQYRC